MPTVRDSLAPEGALVDVRIGLSATQVRLLRTALRPIPAPIAARALLDTGAEMTGVDRTLVQALALPTRGSTLTNLPAHGGLTLSFIHDAALTIAHPTGSAGQDLVIRSLAVLEIPLAPLGYEIVVGRDVLARCRLLYNGPRGRFRLAY